MEALQTSLGQLFAHHRIERPSRECAGTGRDLGGHPLTCTVAGCNSKSRTLRAAAPHYPMLRNFLTTLYEAIRYHKLIAGIDTALRAGKFASLALLCGIDDYTKLFSGNSTDNHADVKQSQPRV